MKRTQMSSAGTPRRPQGFEASGADSGPDVTARQFKRVQHCVAPATPATWNRYIDSRMKQFCSTSR
jgi:hypothetical protein